jgi:hypothetical protein
MGSAYIVRAACLRMVHSPEQDPHRILNVYPRKSLSPGREVSSYPQLEALKELREGATFPSQHNPKPGNERGSRSFLSGGLPSLSQTRQKVLPRRMLFRAKHLG